MLAADGLRVNYVPGAALGAQTTARTATTVTTTTITART